MRKQQIRTLFVFAVTVALSEMDLASYRLVVVILLGLLRGGAVGSLSFSHYSGGQSQDPNDVRFYLYPNSTCVIPISQSKRHCEWVYFVIILSGTLNFTK